MAWVTGCLLLLLLFICGWTGYVMVWDTFGEHLAREGARMLDTLPVLSEPTSRAFTGEQPVPTVFFFLNLFAHIGIPLAMGVVFWLHVKRLSRPHVLPPRLVMWLVIAALTATAMVWPLGMAPQANPFVPARATIPADFFFAFWIPIARVLGGAQALLLATGLGVVLLAVPWLTARHGAAEPPPSVVDEDICVGCVQCSIDCPYGAITMFERTSRRSDLVARVDPDLCVSCGICAGSCAPMGVGPPGRTGRDQMVAVREFVAAPGTAPRRDRRHRLRSRRRDVRRRHRGGGRRAIPDRLCWQPAHVGRRDPRARRDRRRADSGLPRARLLESRGTALAGRPCLWRARSRAAAEGRARPGPHRARRARERGHAVEVLRAFAGEIASLGPRTDAEAPEAEVQCEPALVERRS